MRRLLVLAALVVGLPVAGALAKPTPPPAPPHPPRAVLAIPTSQTSLAVGWIDLDNRAVTSYRVYVDGSFVVAVRGWVALLSGLECGHAYAIGVESEAAGIRSATRATTTGRTLPCPVVHEPSAPEDLRVTAVSPTTVSLAWSAGDGDRGHGAAVSYGVYRDGVLVATTSSRTATLAGLTCEHLYAFAVDSVNAAGVRSRKRAATSARTAACPDVTPPTIPRELHAVSAQTSISLTWAASTDAVGVVSYALSLDGRPAGSATTTQAAFPGLVCGHAYVLGFSALDSAGNRSDRAELTASTTPCPTDLAVAPGGFDYGWSFVSAVFDGNEIRLYVNGALVATQGATGAMAPSAGPLRIGGNDIWGEMFSGDIDNVRIYGRTLSLEQLAADRAAPVTPTSAAPASDGLVAAYSFDEGAGLSVSDASGNANGGAITGATWTQGRFGGALAFDGDHSFVTVADSNSLDLSSAMTLEAWVHPKALGTTWRTAIIKEAGTRLAYALYANTDTGQPAGHVFVGADTWARAVDPLPVNDCRTAAQPCRTFDRAYRSALPGQVVRVAGGTYPAQTLLYDASKEGASEHVVFQPAGGANVTIDGNVNISDFRMTKGASHVTVRDMTLLGDVNLEGCGVPDGTECPPDGTAGTNDLTFQNLRVKGNVAFLCHSCSNVSILGGTWGPDTYLPCSGSNHPEVSPGYDATTFVKLKRPNHILIDGARFQNFARCTVADHTECLQFEPADFVTIRNSVFTKCDTITLAFFTSLAGASLSPAGYAAPDHIVLENNIIDHSYDATGGPTYHGLQISECTNCVIRNNSWLQNTKLPCNAPCGEISLNNVVVGNIGPQSDCGDSGTTFSHNVFLGLVCGPTDKPDVTDLGFVDASLLDLRPLLTSVAVDAGDPASFPARDIDGRPRPLGAAPDAGAYELH
jgi:chitodextrinase